MVRVGILGTSNSAMARGYQAGLSLDRDVSIAINVSVGLSHPVLFPYQREKLDGVELDCLILDFCVNEQIAVNYKAVNREFDYDLTDTTKLFTSMLVWCAEKAIIPVVLILPLLGSDTDDAPSKVRHHWIGLCEKNGVPYFDGYEFVRAISFYGRSDAQSLFIDVAHLHESVQILLGRRLSACIAKFCNAARVKRRLGFAHSYKYIPFAEQNLIYRASSIVADRFMRLSPGSDATLYTGRGAEVVGAAINLRQSNCFAIFSGKNALLKRYETNFFQPDQSILLAVWSLLTPVRAVDGRVRIGQVAVDSGRFEDNDHCPDRITIPPVDEQVVEMAGIVVRYPRAVRWLASTEGPSLDLQSTRVSDDILIATQAENRPE